MRCNGILLTSIIGSRRFYHTSKQKQVKGVLKRYYQSQTDLLLLHIDETKLLTELKYELAPSANGFFLPIYEA